MTIENFNKLNEKEKVVLIFEASKITEKLDDTIKYQLFKIDNFYIETKTSVLGKFKRTITTYTLKDLPAEYAGQILSIPLVLTDEELKNQNKKAKSIEIKRNIA